MDRIKILLDPVCNQIIQLLRVNGPMTAGELFDADVNVSDLMNKSKGEYAYSLLDLDSEVSEDVVSKLDSIEGVLRVRVIK